MNCSAVLLKCALGLEGGGNKIFASQAKNMSDHARIVGERHWCGNNHCTKDSRG